MSDFLINCRQQPAEWIMCGFINAWFVLSFIILKKQLRSSQLTGHDVSLAIVKINLQQAQKSVPNSDKNIVKRIKINEIQMLEMRLITFAILRAKRTARN